MKRQLLLYTATYSILLLVFTSAVILTNLIPKKQIAPQVLLSLAELQKEGIHGHYSNFPLFKLDGFTDALMFNIMLSGNSEKPIESAMINHWHSKMNDYKKIIPETEALAKDDREIVNHKKSYGRYWHGYTCITKPMLCFFDYTKIRIINYIFLTGLFIITLIYIYISNGAFTALAFSGIILLMGFHIIPLSLQYSPMYYIVFLSIIVMLRFRKRITGQENVFIYFFVIGGITCFWDFLTTPLLSLGMPLLIYMQLEPKNRTFARILKISCSWLAGYALLWASKWLLSSLLTDNNIFADAAGAILTRTVGSVESKYTFSIYASTFCTYFFAKGFFLFLLVPLVLFLLFINKKREAFLTNWTFLAVASFFPLWFILVKNHSLIHLFFTWRGIQISLFAVSLFIYNMLDYEKIEQIKRHLSIGRKRKE